MIVYQVGFHIFLCLKLKESMNVLLVTNFQNCTRRRYTIIMKIYKQPQLSVLSIVYYCTSHTASKDDFFCHFNILFKKPHWFWNTTRKIAPLQAAFFLLLQRAVALGCLSAHTVSGVRLSPGHCFTTLLPVNDPGALKKVWVTLSFQWKKLIWL